MSESGIPQQNRRGIEVSGRVTDSDGAALPLAALTLVDATGRQVGRATAGDDGRFQLHAPAAGSYVLITSAAAHQPEATTVGVADLPVRLEISLRGTGGLSGVVRAATTGVPIMNAAVTLTGPTGDVIDSGLSGPSGDYAFVALPPGSYVLAVSAQGYQPTAAAVTTSEAGTKQDVELGDGAMIRGAVRLPDGPRPTVTVTLLDQAGHVVRTTFADDTGKYVFHDLDAGTYTVVATSYSPVRTAVEIPGTGRFRHDVQLA